MWTCAGEPRLSRTLGLGRTWQDRQNPHDPSEDDGDRAGRDPERCRLDADGGFLVPVGEGTAINLARRNTDLGVVYRDGLDGDT